MLQPGLPPALLRVWACRLARAALQQHRGAATQVDFGELRRASEAEYRLSLEAEAAWPKTPQQRKYGARVERALNLTLESHPSLRELASEYGMAVNDVRISPDKMTAHVLWECYPGHAAACQQEVERRAGPLRASVARVLATKKVPRLAFVYNQPTEEQAAVEAAFRRAEQERAGLPER